MVIGAPLPAFFVLVVFIVFVVLSPEALAWGSVTHAAICRAAGGGADFALGGVAPDMIALYSVTTGDDSYDYAHNYYGGERAPVFGDLMASVSGQAFSRGWAAHQLADSVVHGPEGYSNTKAFWQGIPDRYRTTLNHGTVELIVDAIVLDEFYGSAVDLSVPDRADLIHTTAVSFYNAALPAGTRVPRGNIINCHQAEAMAYRWDLCLNTNKYLAELILEEPWFSAVRRNFDDFRPLFSESAQLAGGRAALPAPRAVPSASFWDRLVGLLPAAVARAADASGQLGTSKTGEPADYFVFLSSLSERARQIGKGRIDKQSVRQAVVELDRAGGLSESEQVWAAALAGLTDKHTDDLEQVSQRVRKVGRRASREGAAGGRSDGVLLYLPCAAALAVGLAGLAWLLNRR